MHGGLLHMCLSFVRTNPFLLYYHLCTNIRLYASFLEFMYSVFTRFGIMI